MAEQPTLPDMNADGKKPIQQPLPPKGTHVITSAELNLPVPVDMARAMLNTELNYFCYRQKNKNSTKPKYNQADAERVQEIAGMLGYQAFVITTSDQQAIIYYNNHEALVAFEGSRFLNSSHYFRNLSAFERHKVDAPAPFKGKLHGGFSGALDKPIIMAKGKANAPSLYEAIRNKLENLSQKYPDMQLHLTGHSSGGALAAITAARLYGDLPALECQSIYTFAQPRFSDRAFKDSFQDNLGRIMFRNEDYGDPAPAWPIYDKEHWVHCGQWIPMDEHGRILAMNDDSIIQDTLSRSDPEKVRLPENDDSIVEDTLSRSDPEEIRLPENETLSKSTDILWPQGFFKHRLRPYAETIHKYLLAHPQEVDQRDLRVAGHGFSLWNLSELYDRTETLAPLLQDKDQQNELWDIRHTLDTELNNWESLQRHPGEKLYSDTIARNNPGIEDRKSWSWSKEVPDHRIHAHRLSRSKLFERNLATLENTLYRYQNLLREAAADQHPSSSHSLIDSTNTMIDQAIHDVRIVFKDAPDIYERKGKVPGIA